MSTDQNRSVIRCLKQTTPSGNASRDEPYTSNFQQEVFEFEKDIIRPGRIFRFVVRETVQPGRYANYTAIPRNVDKQPFVAGVEVTSPGAPRLTGLDAFCQALLNLNEFVFVQ